jgi:methyltransferase (TIGR00027 family)
MSPALSLSIASMKIGKPSETALRAAVLRAAHQFLDQGAIFKDPLAARILGSDSNNISQVAQAHPCPDQLRWFMAMRSRVAEDALAKAVIAHDTRQLVILGAGLDTYAYRGSLAKNLRIFEVDHPATQRWKRHLLAKAAIPLPDALTYVPVEFEDMETSSGTSALADALGAAGFDLTQRTFVIWLGVVVYLSKSTILSTLSFIANLPGGADVVFDYGDPIVALAGKQERALDKLASLANEMGETFQTFFHTSEIRAIVASLGFRYVADLGPIDLAAQFLNRSDCSLAGCHIMQAAT